MMTGLQHFPVISTSSTQRGVALALEPGEDGSTGVLVAWDDGELAWVDLASLKAQSLWVQTFTVPAVYHTQPYLAEPR